MYAKEGLVGSILVQWTGEEHRWIDSTSSCHCGIDPTPSTPARSKGKSGYLSCGSTTTDDKDVARQWSSCWILGRRLEVTKADIRDIPSTRPFLSEIQHSGLPKQ